MTFQLIMKNTVGPHEKFNRCHEGVKGSRYYKCGKRYFFDLNEAIFPKLFVIFTYSRFLYNIETSVEFLFVNFFQMTNCTLLHILG